MEIIERLFGKGEALSVSQMSLRAFVMFIIAVILIRISGRRSFSLHTAADNIISIALGAILSRGVVGTSPFWGVVAAGLVFAIMHRGLHWLSIHSLLVQRLIAGNRILVYAEGKFILANLRKALVSKEEIEEEVSRQTLTEHMEEIEKVYIGSTGEFIVIKKLAASDEK